VAKNGAFFGAAPPAGGSPRTLFAHFYLKALRSTSDIVRAAALRSERVPIVPSSIVLSHDLG